MASEKYKIIPFSKPTHKTDNKYWVNLRVELVEAAKRNKEMIILELPQGYTKPIDPKDLLRYGKRVEAIYLYPQNPMQLIGMYFELLPPEKEAEIKNRDLIAAVL